MTDFAASSGRIVVVEDDEALGYVVARALATAGHEVTSCLTAEEALRHASDADVIVADVLLPGEMSGLALLQEVRRRGGAEVVVITGHGSLDLSVEALRAGAADLLLKPFEASSVVDSVRRALERQHLRGLAALNERCRLMMAQLGPSHFTEQFARWAAGELRCDRVSLLVPTQSGALEVVSSHGLSSEAGVYVPSGGVAARVAAGRVPVLLQGRATDDARFRDTNAPSEVRSSVVWPILSGGELTAVLCVGRASTGLPLRERDLGVVQVLAQLALFAIELRRSTLQNQEVVRLAAMGEVAAGVAHEINNPMAFVRSNLKFVEDCLLELLGTVALLNEGKPQEALSAWDAAGGPGLFAEVQHAISEAVEGADRISALIRDMRHVSRIQASVRELFPLHEAVDSAVRLAGATLHDVEVTVDVPRGLSVEADRGRISQAVLNLVVNAAHAMEGVARRQLWIRGRCVGRAVTLDVEDVGSGIAPEVAPRVFEPFFTTRPPGKGTGLGLPIARHAIRAHGGELSFTPRAGGGTVFTVTLPQPKDTKDTAKGAPRAERQEADRDGQAG